MKFKSIFASMLVAGMLASCSNDDEGGKNGNQAESSAYMSINVKIPTGTGTRSSGEGGATTEEAAIIKLYAVMFDANDEVVTIGTSGAIDVPFTPHSAGANSKGFAVNPNAEKLLLIANPGTKLFNVIINSRTGDTFSALNAAIQSATKEEIIDNAGNTKGFTMINSGDEAKLLANDAATTPSAVDQCLVSVVGHIEYDDDDATAAAAAENNPVGVKIERLSSKIVVKADGTATGNASFNFKGWVLDVLNTQFYPYASKVNLDNKHTVGFYNFNFYTIDPNYIDNTGLDYNDRDDYVGTANAAKWNDKWNSSKENADYCIENTMKAAEQRFMNATRLIVKATYYPDASWTGDWFSFRSDAYETLADLQTAYSAAGIGSSLVKACDNFYDAVKVAGTSVTATDFLSLTQAELTALNTELDEAGGEIVRIDDCIRWYPKGLNYYWYEIRHSNDIKATMAFGKYGVVRNNFYTLNVKSVENWGTPWYPSVDPKDPDPEGPEGPDPIDEEKGYLAVDVTVAPWITWEHEINW